MPRLVSTGWLEGHPIRRARKEFRCDYWRGKQNGGWCRAVIRPGDDYVEGEVDPYRAGGFGHDRYCLTCAGPEAEAAAAVTARKTRASDPA